MAIEKERKFLVKELPNNLKDLDVFVDQQIQQGYLMFGGGKQLRVRIINSKYINEALITYKTKIDNVSRNEYEYRIPMEDAVELMESTNFKLNKRRRMVDCDGLEIAIDEYPNGLIVAEIEYENELEDIPNWLGEDITNVKKYSNLHIAMFSTTENVIENETI